MTGECSKQQQSRLLIHDPATNYKFLIDTGADISVLPCPINKKASLSSNFPVYAANGSRIATYGTQLQQLTLGMHKNFPWRFMIADVASPILGADFLKHYGLIVDLKNACLIDSKTNQKARGYINSLSTGICGLTTVRNDQTYGDLLKEFIVITRPRPPNERVKHEVKHTIETKGPPFHSKFRTSW